MKPPRTLAPLVSGATYRRGVHLLLGTVIALPYLMLVAAFRQMLADDPAHRSALLLTAVAATAIATVPAFLSGTRALEIAAARSLLGVDLPDATPGGRPALETRIRCALWFGLHLAAGVVIATVLLTAVPVAVLGLGHGIGSGPRDWPLPGPAIAYAAVAWLFLTLVLLAATGYAVAALGALATLMAPILLGPSATERERALEDRARELAGRHQLARELHDSIGHALTLAVLQSGAAGRLFDTDPQFARRALSIIEETSRTAMDDLDHVLGVLRDPNRQVPEHPGDAAPAPHPTLAHLGRLCEDARAAGVLVSLTVTGPLTAVPVAVSREGFRIVQEALTNVARHAGHTPATLLVTVAGGELAIEVLNPLPAGQAVPQRAGRGLEGMRERADLLRGRLTTGRQDDMWRVAARLPLRDPADDR